MNSNPERGVALLQTKCVAFVCIESFPNALPDTVGLRIFQ